jgi:hypothetical protein
MSSVYKSRTYNSPGRPFEQDDPNGATLTCSIERKPQECSRVKKEPLTNR